MKGMLEARYGPLSGFSPAEKSLLLKLDHLPRDWGSGGKKKYVKPLPSRVPNHIVRAILVNFSSFTNHPNEEIRCT